MLGVIAAIVLVVGAFSATVSVSEDAQQMVEGPGGPGSEVQMVELQLVEGSVQALD